MMYAPSGNRIDPRVILIRAPEDCAVHALAVASLRRSEGFASGLAVFDDTADIISYV